MVENCTVAIQRKKKLFYRKVDFKENVRPSRVLTALHWLVNNSELYKTSDIAINVSWFQEVTESAKDTVREFLEATTEQTNGNVRSESQKHEQSGSAIPKDWTEKDGSDGYSEIDAKDHVGNVDTLVDDADIENKYDQVFNNARSLNKHLKDIEHEPNMLAADVIGFAESQLCEGIKVFILL